VADRRQEAGAVLPNASLPSVASATVSTGKFNAIQPARPPCNGWTRVMPLRRSRSATRALVASLGQEQ
jgi:hypothetical protein